MKNEKMHAGSSQSWLLCLFFSLFLGGCVFGVGVSSQALQRNLEVERIFREGTFLPDHTYYMQGTYPEPEAIIAVSNTVQLQSQLWSKVEWSKKELDKAVFWMEESEMGFCTTDGGYLFTQDGQQIGIWFSKRDISVIKQPSPGIVEIYPFRFGPGSPCQRQHVMMDL